MKRSKQIDLGRMRKQPLLQLTKLAAAVGGVIALSGCGSDETAAKIYANIDACRTDNPDDLEGCDAAYQQAVAESAKTAPRYDNASLCEAQFGRCVQGQDSGGSWFMPALAGFMVGQMLDGRRDSSPVYTGYGRLYGGYYGADGSRYGDFSRNARVSTVNVDRDAFKPKPKPKVTKTLSRGGFGSTAVAKSSWGGRRSGGWGG